MAGGYLACMQRHLAFRAHLCILPSLDRPSSIPSGGTTLLLCMVRALDLSVLETPNPRASSGSRPQPVPGPQSWHAFLLQRYTAPWLSGSLDLPTGAPHVHSYPVHSQQSSAAGPARTPGHEFTLQHASFPMRAEKPVWIVQVVLFVFHQNDCRRSVHREMLNLPVPESVLPHGGHPLRVQKPLEVAHGC